MRLLVFVFAVVSNASCLVVAQDERSQSSTATEGRRESASAHNGKAPLDAAPLSEAERIARLQRSISESEARLAALQKTLDAPDSEYRSAESEFLRIDKEVQEQKKQGADEARLADLQTNWGLARKRFDLAIQERKAQQEQISALQLKLQQDGAALMKLRGQEAVAAPESSPGAPQNPPAATQALSAPPATAQPPSAESLLQPTNPGTATAQGAVVAPPAVGTPEKPRQPSEQLSKARELAAQKEEAAQEAQREVQSVAERLKVIEKSIESERKLFGTARQRVATELEAERSKYDELQRKYDQNAPPAELTELRTAVSEIRTRIANARQEVVERTDRLDKLQDELQQLQVERIAALEEAEQKSQEAMAAKSKVTWLESPFSRENLVAWIRLHGPALAAILLAVMALLWITHWGEGRLVRILAGRTDHGTFVDRENRARTLVSVFRGTATVAIIVGGAFMLFTEVGVNIVPLMGGAAVVGLAVAFGAQNLIRDFFYGFMILLENQYTINDVVKIDELSGQVERISLRLTALRASMGPCTLFPTVRLRR